MSHHEIYDIGTEILLLQKNDHNSTQIQPFSKIPEDPSGGGPPPLQFCLKARFKAFWDIFFENLHATMASQVTDFAQDVDLSKLAVDFISKSGPKTSIYFLWVYFSNVPKWNVLSFRFVFTSFK